MRREKRAEQWYRKAVALKSNTTTHIYLGACLARQGRFVEAKRHHRQAIRLATDPKYDAADEAYFNLGLILRAERKYTEASAMFRKAIRLDRKYQIAREALRDVELAARLRKSAG
jgi:Tfp pilus assembly protein PilF